MSSLSKVTIEHVEGKIMQLKIERIHPDALSLKWLHSQNEKILKITALFRVMGLLEANEMKNTALYKEIFSLTQPVFEEETIDLDEDSDLTEQGNWVLEGIIHKIVDEVTIIDEDINDNWEKGLLKTLNPYKTENRGVPYVILKITFNKELLENSLVNQVDYSAMSISCAYN